VKRGRSGFQADDSPYVGSESLGITFSCQWVRLQSRRNRTTARHRIASPTVDETR
jgi:hypothetical protein